MTDKTPAEEVLCPVALTLSLIGGKWKALILWNLLEGTMRYSALRKAVPDATPKMLTRLAHRLARRSASCRLRAHAHGREHQTHSHGHVPLGRRLSGEKKPEVLLLDEAARRRIVRPESKRPACRRRCGGP